MPYYPPKVNEKFTAPARAGRANAANAAGTGASFVCGCFARVTLAVGSGEGVIEDARYATNGCGYMTAAAEAVTASLIGRELTDLHAMEGGEFTALAESDVGPFPPERRDCLAVVLEAVRAAFADLRAARLEEFVGERALVCTCFGVSEDTIDAFIAENDPDSVDEVTAACRAGGGCGSCRMIIQEMIDMHA